MSLLPRGIDPSLSSGYPSYNSTAPTTPLTHEQSLESSSGHGVFLQPGVVVDTSKIHGRGQHGVIYLAKWNGARVAAVKVLDAISDCANRDFFYHFFREAEFLSKLKHPNILEFFGFFNDYGSSHGVSELSPEAFIIQELPCCTLDVRNRQQPTLNLRNVIDISIGVTSALCFLHERPLPIVHYNLTSQNIFLDFCGLPKIGNLAVTRTLGMRQHQTPPRSLQQSVAYMAPEVRYQTGMTSYSSFKVDIYSFGVVMLEICIGRDCRVEDMMLSGQPQSLLPEVERRKVDFKDLGTKHPLRPLIMSCLSEIDARPSAQVLNKQLEALSLTELYLNSPPLPVVSQLGVGSMEQGGVSREFTMNSNSLKELTAMNEALQEENATLKADRNLFKRKLDEYIQYEKEEAENSSQEASKGLQVNEQEIEKLMSENVKLQEALLQKDEEMIALSSPPSSLTDTQLRDQRASLMQKINELQASKKEELEKALLENRTLRNQNKKLQVELQVLKSAKSSRKQHHTSMHHFPQSNESGPMSLPEQLPSFSSTSSSSHSSSTETTQQLPSLSSLHISSSSSSSGATSLQSTAPDSAAPSLAEFKRLKKQLEKYKSVNIELDERLKDAKLELQKYGGRQVNTDIMYRMDIDRLRAENSRLQSQLDSALSENNRLRSYRRY